MRNKKTAVLYAILSFVCFDACAQAKLSGGQTVSIQNSRSLCIVPSKDSVSITITSVRVPSSAPWPTWLKNTKAFGAKVDLAVDGPSGTGKRASFPIGKMVTQIRADNSAPTIRATLNVPVLTKYKLADNDGNFSHIEMPLTLVQVEDNQGMKSLFDALSKITNGIKLPISPFEPGVRAFGSFVSDIFTASTSSGSAYPHAILGFELADNDEGCEDNPQALRSGAQAQIFTSPHSGTGIIDIGAYTKYCYYATQEADPNISFIDKPSSGVCPATAPVAIGILNNPQVVFVVNRYPINPIVKPASLNIAPELAVTQRIGNISSSVFSAFANNTQKDFKVSERTITLGDFASLKEKISISTRLGRQADKAPQLSPAERGALSLTEAIDNCKMVGLDVNNCN